LKGTLFELAQKRRQKTEKINVYRFPDAEDDEDKQLSRRDQLFNKLN
jgi:hypothetical protein